MSIDNTHTARPLVLLALMIPGLACAQPPADLDEALEKTTRAAIARVAPSIVQIRTIGGLEIVGGVGRQPQMTKGQGPTTGVIVAADGWIITSSFNFVHKPAAITVTLPNRKEPLNARVVAHDHTRMLTLLKIEADGLPVPAGVSQKETRIGQWSLALGKSWADSAAAPPSVSVGIISATERIWGKALQTDAKVSPVNYGGPLVDMQGRVLGILVPLDPQTQDELTGVQWYDGGIGFAIPFADVLRVLPELKQGKDLKRGVLGVTFESKDRYSAIPTIGSVAYDSTAARAGIQQGDQIVEVDGQKVVRQAQIQHVLGNKYEGDKVSLKVMRGEQSIDLPNLILQGDAASYVHAFLGIMPMRDDPTPGVEVRHVFPGTPAADAGIKVGDRIISVDKQKFSGRDQLLKVINLAQAGNEVEVEVKRKGGDKPEKLRVKLAAMSSPLPTDELPEASKKKALEKPHPAGMPPGLPMPGMPPMPREPKKEDRPDQARPDEPRKDARKGYYVKKDEITGHEAAILVPDNYDPNVAHALVVWLHPAGDTMDATMQKIWRDLAAKHHLIILAPRAENPAGWLTSEVDFVTQDIREVLKEYTIDRQRIVAHGLGRGGDMAIYLAFDTRDLIRGAAVVGATLSTQPRENLPDLRLQFFVVAGARDPAIEAIRALPPRLQDKKFPIISRELPNHGNGYPTDPEVIRDLLRWIEALDRA